MLYDLNTNLLPMIGGAISGESGGYANLNATVKDLPRRIRDASFFRIGFHPLTWGMATLYVGDNNSNR